MNIHPDDYMKGFWQTQVQNSVQYNIEHLEKCFKMENDMEIDFQKPLYVINNDKKEEIDIIDYKHRTIYTFNGNVYPLDESLITN